MSDQIASDINTARLFDHTRFVELHNALLDQLDNHAPETEIDEQLNALQCHLQQQFSAEETGMQAANFPGAAAHKKHHDHALNKLAQRITQWHKERNRKKLQDYAEDELAGWFVSHVNLRDFVTARHIGMQQAAQ